MRFLLGRLSSINYLTQFHFTTTFLSPPKALPNKQATSLPSLKNLFQMCNHVWLQNEGKCWDLPAKQNSHPLDSFDQGPVAGGIVEMQQEVILDLKC